LTSGAASKKATMTFAGEENLPDEASIDGGKEYLGPFPSEWNATASVTNSAELGE
jgi:hypothetical protein